MLARPRFLRHEHDLGYLLRALRNTFFSTRRTASRRPVTQPLEDAGEPADERSEWRPDRAAETNMVCAAIAELSDEYRDALVAVDVAGLSYREAASRASRFRGAGRCPRLTCRQARMAAAKPR